MNFELQSLSYNHTFYHNATVTPHLHIHRYVIPEKVRCQQSQSISNRNKNLRSRFTLNQFHPKITHTSKVNPIVRKE